MSQHPSIYESLELVEHIVRNTDLPDLYLQQLEDHDAAAFQELVRRNLDKEVLGALTESGFLCMAYDHIKNNGEIVSEYLLDNGNDAGPFPTGVQEYQGIYWAYSMECDDTEFFLTVDEAESASEAYSEGLW